MGAFVPVHDVSSRRAGSDRHARAESFCHADDVGLDPFVMIEREHLARAAHAGLHLVDDQHYAVLVADPPDLLHKSRRGRNVAALALNDFEYDAGDFFRRCGRRKKSLLYPVDRAQAARAVVAFSFIERASKAIWIRHVDDVQRLTHEPESLRLFRTRQA